MRQSLCQLIEAENRRCDWWGAEPLEGPKELKEAKIGEEMQGHHSQGYDLVALYTP